MSIRQWLELGGRQFRSRSTDIGYLSIAYANGIYVAVGYQQGFPPSLTNANAGGPVSCAGCSWSPDGYNWTDAQLPFAGTSTYYTSTAFNGTTWQALSLERIGSARTANYVCSTDNARTWVTDPAGRQAGVELVQNFAVGDLFFATGSTTTAIHERGTGYRTGAARVTEAAGASGWTASCAARGTTAGMGSTAYGMMLSGNSCRVYNAGSYATGTAPWGNAALGNNGSFQPISITHTPLGFFALITDQNLTNQIAAGLGPRGRNIWQSETGATWALRATLPYEQGVRGPYFGLAYGSGVLAAIGTGVMMCSKNGVNWTEVAIPAGLWRSVASDGTNFVCVSESGDRLLISGASLQTRIG
jgi:hypothetical protein